MHELGIAEDILKRILEVAKERNAEKVSKAKIKLGEIHMAGSEEIEFAFDVISRGTIADGAKLIIEIIPLRARCGRCGRDFTEKMVRLDCPACGGTNLEVISGKELDVTQIEV